MLRSRFEWLFSMTLLRGDADEAHQPPVLHAAGEAAQMLPLHATLSTRTLNPSS